MPVSQHTSQPASQPSHPKKSDEAKLIALLRAGNRTVLADSHELLADKLKGTNEQDLSPLKTTQSTFLNHLVRALKPLMKQQCQQWDAPG